MTVDGPASGPPPVPARLTSRSRSIAGSVAVVTGAGSGMGRATAHLFADEGARVAVVDRDGERVRAVCDEIGAVHGEHACLGLTVDVGEPAALHRLVDDVVARFGGIDIVVNNAGISTVASAGSSEAEFEAAWSDTFAVNVTAQARLVRAALPWLRRAAHPRVVNVASTEAIVATAGIAAYTASKHAVVGLTRSLAVELGRYGITVNCVCPGPIDTAMTASIPNEAKATYARRRVALRRYGDPEEVAHVTLSLVLPAASYVTGATVVVDGGLTVRHT